MNSTVLTAASLALSLAHAATAAETMSAHPLDAAQAKAGQGAETPSRDRIDSQAYACPDGSILRAVYVDTAGGGAFAVISRNDALIPMEAAPATSGALYVATSPVDPYRLHIKGSEASLHAGETPLHEGCTAE